MPATGSRLCLQVVLLAKIPWFFPSYFIYTVSPLLTFHVGLSKHTTMFLKSYFVTCSMKLGIMLKMKSY